MRTSQKQIINYTITILMQFQWRKKSRCNKFRNIYARQNTRILKIFFGRYFLHFWVFGLRWLTWKIFSDWSINNPLRGIKKFMPHKSHNKLLTTTTLSTHWDTASYCNPPMTRLGPGTLSLSQIGTNDDDEPMATVTRLTKPWPSNDHLLI